MDKHHPAVASTSLQPRTLADLINLVLILFDRFPPDSTGMSKLTAVFTSELRKAGIATSPAKRLEQTTRILGMTQRESAVLRQELPKGKGILCSRKNRKQSNKV